MKPDGYRDDICAFAEAEYHLAETGVPIGLQAHQKRILRDIFTRDSEGRFPYQTVIYSAPKKSGKTEIGGLVALWMALTEGPYAEIYTPANDLEQSQSRVFRAAARAIQANPRLRSVRVGKDLITFPDGTEIKTVAGDYAGAAGANPTLTIWDELWGYTSESARRLWDELTPVPTRRNSMRFIVTYAGFDGESKLLQELYDRGMSGERLYDDLPVYVADGLYCYWDTEARMPWQTPDYYEEQARQLRPLAFARLHRNEWVSPESTAIDPTEWDALVDDAIAPYPPASGQPVYVALDASVGRTKGSDTTAAVAVQRDGERLRLLAHQIWEPRTGGIDYDQTLAPFLAYLKGRYKLGKVLFDPYQLEHFARTMTAKGIPMESFPQTSGNLTLAATALLESVRSRSLRVYPSPDLRDHVFNTVLVESTRGVRLAKEKASRKVDGAVALAMALWGCREYGHQAVGMRMWFGPGDLFEAGGSASPPPSETDTVKRTIEFVPGKTPADTHLVRYLPRGVHTYEHHEPTRRQFIWGHDDARWVPRDVAEKMLEAYPDRFELVEVRSEEAATIQPI